MDELRQSQHHALTHNVLAELTIVCFSCMLRLCTLDLFANDLDASMEHDVGALQESERNYIIK